MLRQKEPLASRLISKNDQILKLFGRDQQLLATYPATVGSTEKPAPSGRLKITGISKNPTYRYDPKYEFKGVRATRPFTIKPGPNSPVGLVWIGLSREGYGIHGTPDPSKVSKTASHGCIRLTNWDALSVASAVAKGTPVDFSGDEESARQSRAEPLGERKITEGPQVVTRALLGFRESDPAPASVAREPRQTGCASGFQIGNHRSRLSLRR